MLKDWMFSFIPFFIAIIFVLVLGFFIFVIISSILTWKKNNSSPILNVEANVATKRTSVSGGMGDMSASTDYFVTFEVSSGDRMELMVDGQEYGQLVEGDRGILKFQGTRYLGFNRYVA